MNVTYTLVCSTVDKFAYHLTVLPPYLVGLLISPSLQSMAPVLSLDMGRDPFKARVKA